MLAEDERPSWVGVGWGREVKEWKRGIGERKKSSTYTPHLDMVLVSFAKKLLMWHEERELAFQRREKCLPALLVREKGLRYTPHISSLFGDFAVASTFYPPYLFSFFFFFFIFLFLFIPFVLVLLNTYSTEDIVAAPSKLLLDRFVPE